MILLQYAIIKMEIMNLYRTLTKTEAYYNCDINIKD